MSNKKAKQARQAERLANGGQYQQRQPTLVPTWVSKPWAEFTENEKSLLKGAGIFNQNDFLRVKYEGVRSGETTDLFWWLTNYGVGFYSNDDEMIEAVARRLGQIERDPFMREMSRKPGTLDTSKMKHVYVWNLKKRDRYFASPYSFFTPEGRKWLVETLRRAGITHLAVDTVDTGDFDINDAIIIDLAEAA